MSQNMLREQWKQAAGEAAAQLVTEGMRVGLGTGSTASAFVRALAQRVQQGLHITTAVPSSEATGTLAAQLGLPVSDLDTYPELDIYVDGADEIDPHLQLLKGAGGALLREKVVATAAQRFVVIGDATKPVQELGHLFPVPVETVPFALTPVRLRLEALGASVQLRQRQGQTFITENHNYILDCHFPNGIANAAELDARIHRIVGVVETGIFIDIATQAIIAGADGVQFLRR